MQILLIEPYYGGSHQAWADSYQMYSHHQVTLLTMPAQFWKWRMQGGAITLARLLIERDLRPDVILASDMINLATFRSLIRDHLPKTPIAFYFHESQLTYPQNPRQRHGWQYGFTNYISALSADKVFFNSQYHLDIFFATVPNMLKHFGDYNELETIETVRAKSSVLPLGLDLHRFDQYQVEQPTLNKLPLIMWNHRWEEEKNPQTLFSALYGLVERNIPFQVALTGENFRKDPEEFEEARERLGEQIVQYGYMPNFADYAHLLWEADYVISTAHQEFFGGAIAEAIYCGCIPLLPNRLNYPYLLPELLHNECLYNRKGLLPLLAKHLKQQISIDTQTTQQHIAQFDWSILATKYDHVLEQIVNDSLLCSNSQSKK